MGFSPLTIRPGVNTQATKMQGEAQYVESNQIRFKDGYLQKNGGFAKVKDTPLTGVARGAHGWADYDGNLYLAFGTNERLSIYFDSAISDITPISSTSDLTNAVTTTSATSIVEIADAGNTAAVGDWIRIINPIYLDGITLFGYYTITESGNTYKVDSGTSASGSHTGGTAVLYSTTNTSTDVRVTYTNHGLLTGEVYKTYFSTLVGGVTIAGDYIVGTVDDGNNFHITASGAATSTTSGSENGGDLHVQYLLPVGYESTTPSIGYGLGSFGVGSYGYGSVAKWTPARQWSFGSWGQNVVASPTDGTIYYFDVSSGVTDNPATAVPNAPEIISGGIFVASSQQQIVAVGASTASSPDPLLLRWCDVADHETWTASATNQAGSFRISRGSKLVGGMAASQQHLIWTDVGLWSMQYIGLPYVYSFGELASGCGLISMRAAAMLGSDPYWMSHNGFFSGASATPIECSVHDKVFDRLLTEQKEKIVCAPNSLFNEVSWFFPSVDGDGEVDSYVTYYASQRIWSYGDLCRTCFLDATAFGSPIGVDENKIIQQHESGHDEDDAAMHSWAKTGWFSIKSGDVFIFLERALIDLKSLSGDPTLSLTVYSTKYANDDIPDADIVTHGPYQIKATTKYVRIRARGRFMSIKIESQDLGTSWRLGSARYYIQEDGEHG